MRRLALAAYEKYVERMGHPPGPMESDYEALVERAWVAEAAGGSTVAIVGLLVLEESVDHLLVENVAVDPGWQGRGLGTRLLHHAEAQARAAGRGEVRLYTHETMTENLAYYPRRGYRETHRESPGGFHRVFFTKVLEGPGPVGA